MLKGMNRGVPNISKVDFFISDAPIKYCTLVSTWVQVLVFLAFPAVYKDEQITYVVLNVLFVLWFVIFMLYAKK